MSENVAQLKEANEFIRSGLKLLDEKKYPESSDNVDKAYEIFKNNNSDAGISVCLSLRAFLDYSQGRGNLGENLELVSDATFMAERSGDITAKMINEMIFQSLMF